MKTVILDAGHGMSNRREGHFDPGAVSNGYREADIVMDWANELRGILIARGARVVRTRIDHKDPAPVAERAGVARAYKGDIMLSLHCNAACGAANGTETFYRGEMRYECAKKLNDCVVAALGTRNRGAKNESESQHSSLAIMAFQPTFLLEIGFIDNRNDRAKMLDPTLRRAACEALADVLLES